MIEVDAISKWYGDHQALHEVGFCVERGTVTGLLGPNGAGKSSILRIIAGVYRPDAGDVRISGVSVTEDPLSARERIGYFPESAPLYPELTAEEHLRFAAQMRGITGSAVDEAVGKVAEQCGIRDELAITCGRLSRGFRQRVCLAAALAGDPSVIVLDEPMSGLDPKQTMEIRELLRSLAESRAILFSTHVLAEAETVCDRFVILHGGRVVADDSVAALHSLQRFVSVKLAAAADPAQIDRLQMFATLRRRSEDGCSLDLVLDEGATTDRVFDWAVEAGARLQALVPGERSLEYLFAHVTGRLNGQVNGRTDEP